MRYWSSDACSSDVVGSACQRSIDIGRRDRLALAGLERILDAAGEVQEAVIVDATAIAGAQPAVIGERFARFRRLAEIAAHDRRMFELDFAVGIEAKPRTGQRSAD